MAAHGLFDIRNIDSVELFLDGLLRNCHSHSMREFDQLRNWRQHGGTRLRSINNATQ